jgi:tRNA(Arg) A34 adenosine deaminase TadA
LTRICAAERQARIDGVPAVQIVFGSNSHSRLGILANAGSVTSRPADHAYVADINEVTNADGRKTR